MLSFGAFYRQPTEDARSRPLESCFRCFDPSNPPPGVLGNLAGVAPSSAIFIAVYEPVKQAVLQSVPANRDYLGPIAAGMAAGGVASLTRVPTEVIKQRLQTKEFAGAIGAVRSIVAKEGLRGLYAG